MAAPCWRQAVPHWLRTRQCTQLVLVCGGNRACLRGHRRRLSQALRRRTGRCDPCRQRAQRSGRGDGELVAIHDAARPFVSESVITAALTAAAATGAAAPAVPVKDTVKMADPSGRVLDTPDRATLYAVQTPQCFRRALYTQALAAVTGEGNSLVTGELQPVLSWRVCPSGCHRGRLRQL